MNNNEEINVFWKNIEQIGEKLDILNKKNENSNDKANILKLQIERIIKEENYDLLEFIFPSINDIFYELGFTMFMQFLKKLDLSEKGRLMLYMKLANSIGVSPIISSSLMINFINNNKISLLNLLKDEEIQKQFSIWFKQELLIENINDDILEEIFKVPKIQEIVLSDQEFYEEHNSFILLNSVPKEYGSVIAFYFSWNDEEIKEDLEQLYFKYFNGILSKEDQLELIKEQIIELKRDDIFELGQVKKMYPFYHLLSRILQNKEYYNWIKNIKNNSKLDFNIILKFIYKYDETKLFKNLCLDSENYNKDKIDKIKYLADENKLVNCEDIVNLDDITLLEFQNFPKEKGDSIKLNVYGGPSGMEGIMFENGYKREIRRIDRDGSIKIFDASRKNHEDGVKLAYPEIQFNENCVMAIERAVEAVKQLSSITFIIENEACYVVSSDNLSEEQIQSLNDLKIVDENKAKFGIITYDPLDDNYKIAYNGESVSFDKMIEYMKSFNSNNKAITH